MLRANVTRASPRRGRASRGKSAGGHSLLAPFLKQFHNMEMFDLENEGQRHGVKHSQWCHSMATVYLI